MLKQIRSVFVAFLSASPFYLKLALERDFLQIPEELTSYINIGIFVVSTLIFLSIIGYILIAVQIGKYKNHLDGTTLMTEKELASFDKMMKSYVDNPYIIKRPVTAGLFRAIRFIIFVSGALFVAQWVVVAYVLAKILEVSILKSIREIFYDYMNDLRERQFDEELGV